MVRISDLALIKELMKNSRVPYTELAEMFGVSEAAIRKRIRRLEEKGVIRKYTLDVDIRKLGFEIRALIGVDTLPENFLSVVDMLKQKDDVISLYTSSGDHMILLETWMKNSEELISFVRFLENVPGITRVCPAILLEKIK